MGLRLAHSFVGAASLLAALLSAVSPADTARAQAGSDAARGPVALHWVRLPETENCIAGDALARVVETKLRRNVFPAPRDASILIEGHVRRTSDGYAAELVMRDQTGKQLGSRELSSQDKSCHELSETLGVVLAVMIDPDAAKRPPSALPPAVEPKAAKSETRAEQHNRARVFARMLFGFTRNPLLGIGAAYERALGVAGGLRIEGNFFLENATPVAAANDTAEAVVQIVAAGIAYCPLWLEFSRLHFMGCAGAGIGRVYAHQSNFPAPPAATRLIPDQQGTWLSANGELRLAYRVFGALEVQLGGGLWVAFGQKFKVTDQDGRDRRILHKRPVAAALDLGLGARF